MYRLRYGRLISFERFDNRRIELEDEFDDNIPKDVAMFDLVEKVTKLHQAAGKQEQQILENLNKREEWQMKLGDMQDQIKQLKEKKAELENAQRIVSTRILSMEEKVESELKAQPS